MVFHTHIFPLVTCVAGPGVAPGLEDYEPSVLLYTTPRFLSERASVYQNCLSASTWVK